MKKTYQTTKILTVLVMYSLTTIVLAQASQQWAAVYNGTGNSTDMVYSMAIDGLGNVYVTGYSTGSGSSQDYTTLKYNSSGALVWIAKYNGPANSADVAYAVTLDASGNIYVTGSSVGNGTNADYTTIKYNSAGTQLWVARYNSPFNSSDDAVSIAVDGSGNVYVTGNIIATGTGTDYTTVKYNSSGIQQWAVRYDGPENHNDDAESIKVTSTGIVYVTGSSRGIGTNSDYTTIKYSTTGVQQWIARYNGTGNSLDRPYSMALDAAGNIYITGESYAPGASSSDYATIKYNSSGVQQWAARYSGPVSGGFDGANAMALDVTGNIYVTGRSDGDYATIKYNTSGVQQWAARYNGPGNSNDEATSMAVYNSSNIYVTGSSAGIGTANDYATVKYNSSGTQQWAARYNGPTNLGDEPVSVLTDASGSFYVTGVTGIDRVSLNTNYATIKYHDDALPVEIAYFYSLVKENNVALSWGTVWELNNSGFRVERQQAGSNNWSDIGFVQGNGTANEANDYTFTDNKLTKGNYKYRLKQIDYNGNYEYHALNTDVIVGTPQNFDISQNYPNPSNPKSKIDFNMPFDGKVSLKVYDITGKEMAVLVDEFRAADFYSVEFDGSKLSSGVYFYNISSGSFFETRKMILIK
jgi:uncharacterized delta-60 repeat protein